MITLYHVTTMDRIDSIEEFGLDPKFAQGKTKASWFVEASRLDWAIMHVSARHRCATDYLVIFCLDMNIDIGQLQTMSFRRYQNGVWMRFTITNDLTKQSVSEYLMTYGKLKS